MAQKIKVGAVSYLNTKPLIYGFEQGQMKDRVELVIDYPSKIATLLMNGQIDIGLVPIAIIPSLGQHYLVSDYCIGCDGEVASVCLFSDVPLSGIKTILLDYQSRTSVELLKIVLKEHWNLNPVIIAATSHFEGQISGDTAGLVIGDRAFTQRLKSKYIYDLGAAWKELTGLPFVFAAWISNRELPENFITEFNAANAFGLENIDEVIRQNPFDDFSLNAYYTNNIKFKLSADMRKAAKMFIGKL